MTDEHREYMRQRDEVYVHGGILAKRDATPHGRWVFVAGMMTWLPASDEATLTPDERDALANGTLGEQPFTREDEARDGCYASQPSTTQTDLAPVHKKKMERR